jgi:hypothetical protein
MKNRDVATEIEYLYRRYQYGWISNDTLRNQIAAVLNKSSDVHAIPYLGRLLPYPELPVLDIDTIIEGRYLQMITPRSYERRLMRKRLALAAHLTDNNSSYFFRTQWEVWDIRMRCWHRDVNRELREQYYPPELC